MDVFYLHLDIRFGFQASSIFVAVAACVAIADDAQILWDRQPFK
jgi:hypothetical protein